MPLSRIFRRSLSTVFVWIVLVHVVLFISFWLTNSLFYSSTNDFLAGILGAPWDYISLVLLLSAGIGLWSGAWLAAGRLGRTPRFSSPAAWLYWLLGAIYILFFYGSFVVLLHEDPVQLPRLVQLLAYYRLVLDPGLFLGLALLLRWGSRRYRARWKGTSGLARILPLVLAPVILASLWILPLLFPPASIYHGALPSKPRIIAHRGASMIAPENTIASAEQAAALGVYGLETDIHISRDGTLYLMHDDTLKRTTDVGQVFPGREKDPAETFAIAEVRRLHAGSWFVDQDPFKTIARGVVTPAQAEWYQSQPVPTLAEELDIVRDRGLVFIFDLKATPAGRLLQPSTFDICLKQIQQAGIDGQVWFLANHDELNVIRAAAPRMKPAAGIDYQKPPAPADLKAAGYQVVNAEYPLSLSLIHQYQSSGLWVNLYTVDEPWQFSRLWMMGVNSITTSNSLTMTALARPILGLPYPTFLALWTATGILGLLLAFLPAIPAARKRLT